MKMKLNFLHLHLGIRENKILISARRSVPAVPDGSTLKGSSEQVGSNTVTTPNYLHNATTKLPNSTTIKNPGDKINTSFIDAVGNNSISRKIVNDKLQ